MVGVRESLYISVIRDRDSRHTPGIGSFDQVLALGHAVHIAHLRMAVQFDPLDLGVVLSLLLDRGDQHNALQGRDADFLVERIEDRRSLDLDPGTGPQGPQELFGERSGDENFAVDRVRQIRQSELDDRLVVLDVSAAVRQDLAADHHFADLSDHIADRDSVLADLSSVEDIGIIGPLEADDLFAALRAGPFEPAPAPVPIRRRRFGTLLFFDKRELGRLFLFFLLLPGCGRIPGRELCRCVLGDCKGGLRALQRHRSLHSLDGIFPALLQRYGQGRGNAAPLAEDPVERLLQREGQFPAQARVLNDDDDPAIFLVVHSGFPEVQAHDMGEARDLTDQ